MGRGRNGRRKRKRRAQQRRKSLGARIEVRPRSAVDVPQETTCPLCRDAVSDADVALPAMRCEGCETIYHRPCFDELGGCSVLGCGRSQASGGSTQEAEARRGPSLERRQEERWLRHLTERSEGEARGTRWVGVGLFLAAIGVASLTAVLSGNPIVACVFLGLFGVVLAMAISKRTD